MPWSATVIYGRGSDEWPETVYAENRHEYYNNKDSDVPQADKPDSKRPRDHFLSP